MNKFFLVLLLCGSLLLPASASDFNLNFTNSSVTITHDNSTFTYITGIYYQTTMSIPNDIYVNNITNNSCSVDSVKLFHLLPYFSTIQSLLLI